MKNIKKGYESDPYPFFDREMSGPWEPQPTHEIRLPLDPQNLNSDFVVAGISIEWQCPNWGIAVLETLEYGVIDWIEPFSRVGFALLGDGVTRQAIPYAVPQPLEPYWEYHLRTRAPVWVQSEEISCCCKRPMNFVGQLDDPSTLECFPDDPTLWWYDCTILYKFACPLCGKIELVAQWR